MYAVIRSFPQMQNVEEARRLAETGLAPILKQQPGFRAYYIIQLEGGGGGSISLFDSADNAKAAHDRSLGVDQGEPREHDRRRDAGGHDGRGPGRGLRRSRGVAVAFDQRA